MIEKYKHIFDQFGHKNLVHVSDGTLESCTCMDCGALFKENIVTIPADDIGIHEVKIPLLFMDNLRLINSASTDAEFFCEKLRILL